MSSKIPLFMVKGVAVKDITPGGTDANSFLINYTDGTSSPFDAYNISYVDNVFAQLTNLLAGIPDYSLAAPKINPTSPKNSDFRIVGNVVYIYASGTWLQIYPPVFQTGTGTPYSPGTQTFQVAGNYQFIVPAYVTSLAVTVVGGGGSGAYSGGGTGGIAGGGGGGGGYAYKTISVTPGATISLTVGVGGYTANYFGFQGVAGGTSSFGSYFSATGGAGGRERGGNNGIGGAGGVGIGGDINISGQAGFDGNGGSGGKAGGILPFGGGLGGVGGGVNWGWGNGGPGGLPGGGGGGGIATGAGVNHGGMSGAGANGLVSISW